MSRTACNAAAVAVTGALLVACSYSPRFESGVTRCATSEPLCPSGFSCDRVRDVCVTTDGGSPQGGTSGNPGVSGRGGVGGVSGTGGGGASGTGGGGVCCTSGRGGGSGAGTGGAGTGGAGMGGAGMGGSNPCGANTCITAPIEWTIGAVVNAGAACPAGYATTKTTVNSGVSVACASGCGCGSPASGSCWMDLLMTIPGSTLHFTAKSGMPCTAAGSSSSSQFTTRVGGAQAVFIACNGAVPCPNCDPIGATAPMPAWQSTRDFCPLAAPGTSCEASGKCAPPATQLCLLRAGTHACPAGFTAQGAAGSWYTGATSSGAACTCGGCGVASGESCANITMSVAYGVCTAQPPGPPFVGSFKGDGTSPMVTNSDPNGWLVSELFPSLSGSPTAGVCGASQAIPAGSYTPTGAQTLCCR